MDMNKTFKKIVACIGILVGVLFILAGVLGNVLPAFYAMYFSWSLLPILGWSGWSVLQGIGLLGLIWGMLLAYVGSKLASFAWSYGGFKV
ncbi:hypothetical protein [Methanothrix sp.]|jgi:hypothetical protein|uniref:hypothetical protein n=1 Tax=Methanothrix sp. TaxID=90426 RepID=UPI001BD41721